jgi:hypothetical protein
VKRQEQEILDILKDISAKKFRDTFDLTVTKFDGVIDRRSSQTIWLFLRLNPRYQEHYDYIIRHPKTPMTKAAFKAAYQGFRLPWSLSQPVDYKLVRFPDDTHFENVVIRDDAAVRQIDIGRILYDDDYRESLRFELLPDLGHMLFLVHPAADKKIVLKRIDSLLTEIVLFDGVVIENPSTATIPRFQTSEAKNTIAVAITFYLREILGKTPAETVKILKDDFKIVGVSHFHQIKRNVLHFTKVANSSPWIFFNSSQSSKPSGRSKPWPLTPAGTAKVEATKKKLKHF